MVQLMKVSFEDDAMISALQTIIFDSQRKIAAIMEIYSIENHKAGADAPASRAIAHHSAGGREESGVARERDHHSHYYYPAGVGEIL